MSKMMRELWIDKIKLTACVLVAVGHFFQSMVTAGIMRQTMAYDWFINTIYSFHVPLFFICSGYLYQKYSCINSFSSWKANVLKKGIVLGVPYFTFSVVTWLLKAVFSGYVNSQNDGFLDSLLLHPASPYWYLYVLFFIFAVTPTFQNRKMAFWCILCAVILKGVSLFPQGKTEIYAISAGMKNEIWFVLGMGLSVWGIPEKCISSQWKKGAVAAMMVFLTGSLVVSWTHLWKDTVSFIIGLTGCFAIFLMALNRKDNSRNDRCVNALSKYTMPVYVMHTIFAAGFRAVLIKLGIVSIPIHILGGLSASFVGPVIATAIMERLKLDVFLYPGKYFRIAGMKTESKG